MRVDLFDFELPPERIAQRPADPRDSARMLSVTPSALELHSLEVYCGHVAERIGSWHRDHELRMVAEQLAARLALA